MQCETSKKTHALKQSSVTQVIISVAVTLNPRQLPTGDVTSDVADVHQ